MINTISLNNCSPNQQSFLTFDQSEPHHDVINEMTLSTREILLIEGERKLKESIGKVQLLLQWQKIANSPKAPLEQLHDAVEYNDAPLVKALLNLVSFGQELNTKFTSLCGYSLIANAVSMGKSDIVKLLVEAGADVNVLSCWYDERTLLMEICSTCPQLTQLLIDHGAKVDATDKDGCTALMVAASYDHLDAARVLVEAGADMTLKNRFQENAFIVAVSNGSLDVAKYLLEIKPELLFSLSQCNQTPLISIASEEMKKEKLIAMMTFLIEKGCDIDQKDEYGRTALMMAAEWGQLDAVQFLVEHGADISAKDFEGKTVLNHALEEACRHLTGIGIVCYLLKKGAIINPESLLKSDDSDSDDCGLEELD